MSTSAERQAQYLARLKVKAALFEKADAARRRALEAQFSRNDADLAKLGVSMSPEERYARAFFLSHPLCAEFPQTDTGCCDALPNGLRAVFGDYARDIDMAAFAVAVREVSSIPLELVTAHSEDVRHYRPEDGPIAAAVEEVRRAADTLRQAGVWERT